MNLDRVSSGKDVPDEINVIIEIPSHSDPVKYEVDKETGAMFVDRFMSSAMHYPCTWRCWPCTGKRRLSLISRRHFEIHRYFAQNISALSLPGAPGF